MSKTTIPVLKCDRCEFTVEVRPGVSDTGWGTIGARQTNGPMRIGLSNGVDAPSDRDICPTCAGDLNNWWSNADYEVCPSAPSKGLRQARALLGHPVKKRK